MLEFDSGLDGDTDKTEIANRQKLYDSIKNADSENLHELLRKNPHLCFVFNSKTLTTPLHYAVWQNGKNCEKIIKVLLEAGADVLARNRRGETPIQRFKKVRITQFAGKMSDVGLREDFEKGHIVLSWCIKRLEDEILTVNDAVDSEGRTLLHYAFILHCEISISLLFQGKANLFVKGDEQKVEAPIDLFWETYNGSEPIEKVIYDYLKEFIVHMPVDTPLDKNGRTKLYYAARYGCQSDVQSLLDEGASLLAKETEYPESFSAFWYVAGEKFNEKANLLLSREKYPFETDKYGQTQIENATFWLCPKREHAKIFIDYFIKNRKRLKLNVNDVIDSKGRSWLYYAIHFGSIENVKLSIDAGAKLFVADKNGYSPFDSIMQKIKGSEWDANQIIDSRGNTCLHHALKQTVDEQIIKYIKALIKEGVDVAVKNKQGESATSLVKGWFFSSEEAKIIIEEALQNQIRRNAHFIQQLERIITRLSPSDQKKNFLLCLYQCIRKNMNHCPQIIIQIWSEEMIKKFPPLSHFTILATNASKKVSVGSISEELRNYIGWEFIEVKIAEEKKQQVNNQDLQGNIEKEKQKESKVDKNVEKEKEKNNVKPEEKPEVDKISFLRQMIEYRDGMTKATKIRNKENIILLLNSLIQYISECPQESIRDIFCDWAVRNAYRQPLTTLAANKESAYARFFIVTIRYDVDNPTIALLKEYMGEQIINDLLISEQLIRENAEKEEKSGSFELKSLSN